MDFRIVSIGALSHNELWNEPEPVRTSHATTTLIRSGDHVILIDPGLPPQVIGARLNERIGLKADAVTDVFLTNFRPAHRAGLAAFEHANWLIGEQERETIGRHLIAHLNEEREETARSMIQQDVALLKRCRPAPDKLAEHVDLFPLPGFTPGGCGLLLCEPNTTTLIAGDAVDTAEHLQQGRVLPGAYDTDQARESFAEAIEIADAIIPGHDTVALNPLRRPM